MDHPPLAKRLGEPLADGPNDLVLTNARTLTDPFYKQRIEAHVVAGLRQEEAASHHAPRRVQPMRRPSR